MLGFKSMRCARILLAGIEVMHMIRKGQLDSPEGQVASAAKQFYSLAF
jgi:putative transposase